MANSICQHYKRRSKFITPCCNKIYYCRFCHDEYENHNVVCSDVKELICTICEKRQNIRLDCENCAVRFGIYACLECKLFDDIDRNQFHCEGCGICRIGGRENFFHCIKCDMCLPNNIKEKHRCVENMSRSNCPVCLEDIHTSRVPCHIPDCGHLIHRPCFQELLKSGHFACPICQSSLIDMKKFWAILDEQVATTTMPATHRGVRVTILCRDCHKASLVDYHVMGLKCNGCGSYNTCQISKEDAMRLPQAVTDSTVLNAD